MSKEISSWPHVTIIMPTFNAERTIRLALESIKNQEYTQEFVEILVIDGGSTDQTLHIAKEWDARILVNPQKQQEYAKHIGLLAGEGEYAIFLDSDEVFEDPLAIRKRINTFKEVSQLRIVLSGGYRKPENASGINDYINIFADPFAWFMQKTNSECDFKIQSWNQNYQLVDDKKDFATYDFSDGLKLPIVDFCAGAALDLSWLRRELKTELLNESAVPRLFYLMIKKSHVVAVLKNDPIIHYSSDSYIKFIAKLSWRVKANIHYSQIPGVGFMNRVEFQPTTQRMKRYFFVIYAASIVAPFLDGVVQFIKTKKVAALAHLPFTIITLVLIGYNYFLKICRFQPKMLTYGGDRKRTSL